MTIIRLHHNYLRIGMTQAILAGDYDITDPALRGYGQYLLDTGHAVVIASEPEPELEPEPQPAETIITLDDLRATYFELAGEEADGRWGETRLMAEIEALSNVGTGSTDS